MNFPEKLRKLRRDRGLTQAALAAELGISLRALIYYESGKRQPPQPILVKFCDFYQVSPDYLLSEELSTPWTPSMASPDLTPDQLLKQVGSLLAGGSLSQQDQDKFLLALQKIQLEALQRRHEA